MISSGLTQPGLGDYIFITEERVLQRAGVEFEICRHLPVRQGLMKGSVELYYGKVLVGSSIF